MFFFCYCASHDNSEAMEGGSAFYLIELVAVKYVIDVLLNITSIFLFIEENELGNNMNSIQEIGDNEAATEGW